MPRHTERPGTRSRRARDWQHSDVAPRGVAHGASLIVYLASDQALSDGPRMIAAERAGAPVGCDHPAGFRVATSRSTSRRYSFPLTDQPLRPLRLSQPPGSPSPSPLRLGAQGCSSWCDDPWNPSTAGLSTCRGSDIYAESVIVQLTRWPGSDVGPVYRPPVTRADGRRPSGTTRSGSTTGSCAARWKRGFPPSSPR